MRSQYRARPGGNKNDGRSGSSMLIALTLLLIVGGALLLSFVRSDVVAASPEQRVPALTVTTATPRREVWAETLTASGAIEPWQETSIGPQVGGYQLIEVRVNVGDHVRRGQVLARLDSSLLRAEEAQLLAEFEQAEADRKRALALQLERAISDQEVLQFVTAARVAAALLASKRLHLKYTDVLAPDDGVISARTATLGAIAPAGAELFRLIRGGKLEWRGELTAAQLSEIVEGQLVELALPDGSVATARARKTAPMLDGRRLGLVYADLVSGSRARAGMYCSGQVIVARTAALVIPAESVVIRDGRTYVLKVADSTATPSVSLQPVTLGRRHGDDTEVVRGLAGAESLVRAGAGFLSDGDIVRLAAARTSSSTAVPQTKFSP